MAFELKNERISYEDLNIFDDLSLRIKKGEKIALIGKSGSGKSTLLKRLYEIKKDNTSYIPQDLGLVNNLSTFHNIYISKLDDNSVFYNLINLIKPFKSEVKEVNKILKQFYLEDKIFEKILNLSGGEKQRVSICRAFFNKKDILLADEPVSSLDEFLSQKVLEKFLSAFETVVCTLHDVELATKNFDRIIGLKDGIILIDKPCIDLTLDDRNILYNVCE